MRTTAWAVTPARIRSDASAATPACAHGIALTRAEYERVRAYPVRFAIAHNHENPESDQVVAEHERYTVVAKLVGQTARQAHRTL